MAKPKTTAPITGTGYVLLFAAVFTVAASISPASSPIPSISVPPSSANAPEPFSTAPPPGPDCFAYLLKLSDCLTYVEKGSNLTKPDKGCCKELSDLVATQPICLCELLGNPDKVGIPVDIKKALTLPSVCKVSTPPVSLCSAIGVPVAELAPSVSPSPSAGGPGAAGPSTGGEAVGSPGNFASKSEQNILIGLGALLLAYFI
ncbi:non-specific lipid transfer protein GPI-anchored 12-like isoform X1 [Primulina huaijiensis]|uniref:non-specific lipid transfer protein GPI-anchored 12-like isoform X1 n=1 Tax=Primulina huaijiensis TaxID=1492673 RepID=UPI003CC730AF